MKDDDYSSGLENDSSLAYPKSIYLEENEDNEVMTRHSEMTNDAALHGPSPMSMKFKANLGFLEDKDGRVAPKVRQIMIKNILLPLGPPPSIEGKVDIDNWDSASSLNASNYADR